MLLDPSLVPPEHGRPREKMYVQLLRSGFALRRHFSFLVSTGIADVIYTWRKGAFSQFISLYSGPLAKGSTLAIPSFSRI